MEMMDLPVATYHPSPVSPEVGRQLSYKFFQPGETIAEYIDRMGWDDIIDRPSRVYYNGRQVERAEWLEITPQNGDRISAHRAAEGGGDGGSDVGQIVFMIAVIALAAYTGGLAAPAYGAAGQAAVSGAVMMGGTLIAQSLFTQKAPSEKSVQDRYSVSAGANPPRPYSPLRIVIGTHRVYPDTDEKAYNYYEGEDQFLNQTFNYGLGHLLLSDHRIGETPLSEMDVSRITANKTWFTAVDTAAGSELKNSTGWVQRTTGANTKEINIDIGAVLVETTGKGELKNLEADFEIQHKLVGTSTWQASPMGALIIGYTPSRIEYRIPTPSELISVPAGWALVSSGYATSIVPYGEPVLAREIGLQPIYASVGAARIVGDGRSLVRRTFKIMVTSGRYDVRIRRTTLDAAGNTTSVTSETNLLAVRSVREVTGNTKGQFRLEMVIKASGQISGAVSQFSSIVRAACEIPTVGNQLVYTSNPAWWFLKLLRGFRHPDTNELQAGVGLSDDEIDIARITEWAAYCTQNKLEVNGELDSMMTCGEALNKIARCGRGSLDESTGKYSVIWDAANQAPIQMFGPMNMRPGSFTVDYVSTDTADEIIAPWKDASADYKDAEPVRIVVPGVTVIGQNPANIDTWGMTNRDQVVREVNLLAAAQLWRRRTISWETDYEALTVSRGSVVLVSHDMTSWDAVGRVFSAESRTSITLDKSVTGTGLQQWLLFRRPDSDVLTSHRVSAWTGDTDTVTLLDPLPLVPGADGEHVPADYVWMLGPAPTPGKRAKIKSIEPLDDTWARIVATDEDPEYYASENDPYAHVPPVYEFGRLPEIANLRLTFEKRGTGNDAVIMAVATWDVFGATPSDTFVFVRQNDGEFVPRGNTKVRRFEFVADPTITYTLRVVVYGDLGASGGSNSAETSWTGTQGVPTPVSNLRSSSGSTTIQTTRFAIEWDDVPQAFRYRVRLQASGGTRGGLSKYVTVVDPRFAYTFEEAVADGGPFRTIVFTVEAENSLGQYGGSERITLSNPAPPAPVAAGALPGLRMIRVRAEKSTTPDYAGMMVWASQSSGFTPNSANLVYTGANNVFDMPNISGTWYFRLAFYDVFDAPRDGTGLAMSAQVSSVAYETAPPSTNLIPNADFTFDTIDWTYWANASTPNSGFVKLSDPAQNMDGTPSNAVVYNGSGLVYNPTTAVLTHGAASQWMSVEAGQRYVFYADILPSNAAGFVEIQFFNVAQQYISSAYSDVITARAGDSRAWTSYVRAGGFVTAPATAVYARLSVLSRPSTGVYAGVYVTRPLFGRAIIGQVDFPVWSAGPSQSVDTTQIVENAVSNYATGTALNFSLGGMGNSYPALTNWYYRYYQRPDFWDPAVQYAITMKESGVCVITGRMPLFSVPAGVPAIAREVRFRVEARVDVCTFDGTVVQEVAADHVVFENLALSAFMRTGLNLSGNAFLPAGNYLLRMSVRVSEVSYVPVDGNGVPMERMPFTVTGGADYPFRAPGIYLNAMNIYR